MTLDNNLNHIPDDDLVLFALQLLPEDRMRQAMPHMQSCDQCRNEIARLQGDLAAYSMIAEPHAPPSIARDRFLRQIAREPRPVEVRAVEARANDQRPAETRAAEVRHNDLRDAESWTTEPRPAESRIAEPRPGDSLPADLRSAESRSTDKLSLMPEAGLVSTPERSPDRKPDRAPVRPPAEPVFSARQSRSLRIESREDDEDFVEERRHPRRAPWVLAWTGWAVAAGCSFVAGLQLHQRQQMQNSIVTQQAKMTDMQKQVDHAQDALATLTAANAMQVALHPTAAIKPVSAEKPAVTEVTPEALAAYLANKGALIFVATHMQPAPAGKTYELWLLPANGQSPIPAGTFKPDAQGSASVVMPQLPKGVQAKGFGVTVENEGGSSTPTLPIVMS